MALLFCDSFDLKTSLDTAKWDGGPDLGLSTRIETSGGRTGPNFLAISGNGANVSKLLPSRPQELFVLFGWRYNFNPPWNSNILLLRDGSTRQVTLDLTPSHTLAVTRNGTTLATGTTVMAANTWYFLELRVRIGSTDGSFELRIEGTTELSASNVNTQATGNAWITSLAFWYLSNSIFQDNQIDDVIVLDTSTPGPNTFLGPSARVEALRPSADGTYTGWSVVPSGSHYAAVDDATPNDDTDYVSSSTVNAKDSYLFQNLASGRSPLAVQAVARFRRSTVSGARQLGLLYRSGGTDYHPGSGWAATAEWQSGALVLNSSPAGGSWSSAELSSAEFGVEVRA